MEETVTKRYRVNVETSVKGVKKYECTVEMTGASMLEVVAESDALVKMLDLRYPAQLEVK